jgi:L-cysteine S-thiosulfotransferase
MRITIALFGAALAAAPLAAQSELAPELAPERVDEVVREAFANAPDDFQPRLQPDEIMQICNASDNNPDDADWDRIMELAQASVVYPEDGELMGDWQRGEALAQSGYGLRFTDYPPARETGGNCYACHQLTEAEVSYGTLGPSLREYGAIRGSDEEAVRAAYDKIYNPHVVFPCSMMPRFGANAVLTPEQIRDIVALLMDPDSPVNQ